MPLDAVDGRGEPLNRLLYYELPRGHAKSTIAAIEALTTAIMETDYYIYIGAGDADQAGITFDILKGMVRRNPRLNAAFKLGKMEASVPSTGSVIRVLTSDAPTAYGLGGIGRGYLFIADELWTWRGRELFDALFTATGKTPYWRGIVLSNAGYDFESVAWEIRELCRTEGAPFYLYAPDGPVASWLTDEWREMQERALPPDVFQRLIQNKWAEGAGSFITRAQLSACVDAEWTQQLLGDGNKSYFAALDLGLKKDRTALSIAHFERESQSVVLDSMRVWQGTRAQPVNIAEIEAAIFEAAQRFRLKSIACDPWQFMASIQRLKAKLPIREWTFTGESVRRLSETLFTLIQSARLKLYKDDELERELLNLNVVQKSYGWRIDHSSGRHDDRAMALGMVAMEALEKGSRRPPAVHWVEY